MGMHYPTGGAYNINQAMLHLDLSSASNLYFEFYWADFNDETEAQDGVFFSQDGGTTFTKVIDLPGASYPDLVYNRFYYNLDSLISANGLSMTSTFVIMFQQYDNYYFHGGNDGFLIDDISITMCTAPISDFSSSPDSTGVTIDFTNLTDDTTATYFWDFGDGNTSTTYDASHAYASPGSYTVCLIATNSCNTDTACQTINVCIPLLADFSSIVDTTGATYTFTYTGTTSASLSYDWSFGDSQFGSGNPISHTYVSGGVYVVTLSVTDLCMDSYNTLDTINVSFASIGEYTNNDLIAAYPNPSQGNVFVDISRVKEDIVGFKIFNSNGQIIRELPKSAFQNKLIEISNLFSGIYLISIQTNANQYSKTIIIE
jgi:PKD repeat protein